MQSYLKQQCSQSLLDQTHNLRPFHQRLFHLMPHLSVVDKDPQHRQLQPGATARNRLQHAQVTLGKLRPVQQKLPTLSPFHATLFTNIHNDSRETHDTTAPVKTLCSASISLALPTQNGVL